MWVYIFLAITVASLVLEFVTTEMVSIWFAGGGLVAMILAIFKVDWYITVPVFIVVSFLMMLLFRDMVVKHLKKGGERTNAESVVGKEFTLLSDISFGNAGTIKVNDVIWDVKLTEEDAELKKGSKVRVLKIEGNKYIVEEVK